MKSTYFIKGTLKKQEPILTDTLAFPITQTRLIRCGYRKLTPFGRSDMLSPQLPVCSFIGSRATISRGGLPLFELTSMEIRSSKLFQVQNRQILSCDMVA